MQQTTYYKLSQQEYGEAPDVALINGNMDVIDTALHRARIRDADIFSETQSYTIGSYVIYQDALYRTNTGAPAGAWDASKWTQVSVTEKLKENERTANRAELGVAQLATAYPDGYDETKTYHAGDLCLYNGLRRCIAPTTGDWDSSAWEIVTFDDVFERKHAWSLHETYTVDTAARTIQRTLPAGVNGIFVRATLAEGSANAEFGIVVKTTARHSIGDIANYIQTSTGYGLAQYTREGGLWRGFLTQRVSSLQASGTHTERMDGYALDDADAEYVEFRTNTSGAVIPSGSKFEIYIRK